MDGLLIAGVFILKISESVNTCDQVIHMLCVLLFQFHFKDIIV